MFRNIYFSKIVFFLSKKGVLTRNFEVKFLKNLLKQLNEESERFIWYEIFTQVNIRAIMNVYRLNNDLESKVSLIALYLPMPF